MILFILLSISCVSATEDNQTDSVALQNDTGDILTETEGTLEMLNNDIQNSPNGYTLTKDYEYFLGTDKKLKEGIVIDRDNYVIDGNGHTIDGFDEARIFKVTAKNVIIKNVIFKRANRGSTDTGGAVRFEKPGTLIGCKFNYCNAAWGAAAYFGSDGTVKDCVFNSNRGDYSDSATRGILYFKGSGTVEGCNFSSNVASYGGAIYIQGNNGIVKNSIFTSNKGKIHSGAIIFNEQGKVENCEFYNNYAPRYGTVSFNGHGSMVNCTVQGNKADSECIVNFVSGGTITDSNFEGNIVTEGTGTVRFSYEGHVTSSVFKNNTATTGGAVYMIDGTITNCEFESNRATNGGAVYCKGTSVMKNNRFKANTARENGGAAYFENDATSENDTLIKNIANKGGGIYFNRLGTAIGTISNGNFAIRGGTIFFNMFGNLTNGAFYNDEADYGGALYCSAGVVIDCSNFTRETAGYNGGAIYLDQSGKGTIDHSNFNNNDALIGGAISSECNLNISNSVFEDNRGLYDTFNIYLGENANLETHNVTPKLLFPPTFKELNFEITSCTDNYLLLEDDYYYDLDLDSKFKNGIIIDKPNLTIDGNGHRIDGAKIARIFKIMAENVTLINITIVNGAPADRVGGTVIFETPGTVINCNFENNIAIMGGAIQFQDVGVVENCTFKSNTAEYDGGAIEFRKTGTVSNSKFLNNKADANGGAIIFEDEGSVINCEFRGNDAQSNGGAIYSFFEIFPPISIENSKFTENTADKGGALFLNRAGTIADSIFANNYASTTGGAIYFFETGTLENCNFTSNYAENGGALYCSYKVALSNCNLDDNHAMGEGGAIFSEHDTDIINCRLTNNMALLGGALHSTGDVMISHSHLENNSADCGGAVCSYGYLTVEHTSFMDNFALEGTNHISIRGNRGLTLNNVTPQNIGPFKVAKIKVVYVENTTYGGIIRIGVWATAYGDPMNEGNASITIDDETYVADVKNGFAEIEIPDLRVGYYSRTVWLDGGENYTEDYAKATFRVAKENANVDVGFVRNSTYGRNVTIVAIVTSPTSTIKEGTLILEVENRSYYANVGTGVCRFEFSDFDVGTYTGILIFDGGLDYYGATGNITFSVNPASVNLNFKNGDSTYGHVAKINVTVTANEEALNEGKVTVNINNEKHTSPVINGTAIIEIVGLDAGVHFATLSYDGTPNYNKPVKTISLTVNPETVELNFNVTDITYGQTVKINASVTAEGKPINEGNVTVNINNKTYTKRVLDGRVTIEIQNLNADTYKGNINYNSGTNYESPTKLISFNVNPKPVELNFNVSDITYGQTVKINVTVTSEGNPINEGNVTVNINNEKYTKRVTDGRVTIEIQNLNADTYKGNINYNSGTNYESPTKLISFNVNPIPVELNFNVSDITYGQTVKISISVSSNGNPINEGNITANINREKYERRVVDGAAEIEISNLNAGPYSGYMIYDGGTNYESPIKAITFKVNPITVDLDFNVCNVTYGETVKINATVSAQGKALSDGNVTVTINNRTYSAPVTNGTATIEISGLDGGTYEGIITYERGENYNCSQKTVSFSVKKQDGLIIASGKSYVINYGGKYSVTVKDINGNVLSGQKVTFTLNGKNIGSSMTNAKGVATISLTAKILKAAKAGTRNLVVKLDGTNYQAGKTVKITISKEKTKIVAKKKTFRKAKKVKKYTITLKNSKNKPVKKVQVTLKVKGKTYKAKTNNKGKATFKIKNLKKKGTFTATIKFKGNGYYKAVTKKVKIKIR